VTGRGARAVVVSAVLGGIVAGTVDVGAACLINQRPISFILHSIAGGLLANRSFQGGAATAWLGLALQELMGILIAVIFVVAISLAPVLRRRWLLGGLAYGVVIFFVMNYVVVPLSAWHVIPHFTPAKFLANLLAMLLFGVIVAYFVRSTSN
jgi:hypothetical protein